MNLTEGYPYWLIKNGLQAAYPKLLKSAKTDVVIIGGGISGALTAWYLTKAGFDCIVVDARTIGLGSTCASTSLLQYELDKPLSELSKLVGNRTALRAYELCYDSVDRIQSLCKKINFTETTKRGSLYFAAYKKDIPLLQAEYKARSKAGFDVEFLQEADIRREYGFSAPAAIYSSQGATTNAYMLTHALHKESMKEGGRVFDRTRITSKVNKKHGVVLRTEEGYTIKAWKVVNATGYEVTEFIDKKIVALHSTYAFASENIQSSEPLWKNRAMLWNTACPYLYMRLTEDNRVIIGGRDEKFSDPRARDKLIRKKTALLAKDFSKLFPDIPVIPEFKWTGTFGSTKDSLPYIGSYNKTPHTYYALGFGGNGIIFSVIAARIIRDLLTGKKNRNTSLFSFNR